jgi:hypothetical protein
MVRMYEQPAVRSGFQLKEFVLGYYTKRRGERALLLITVEVISVDTLHPCLYESLATSV